jgi:apolipoprotein N-acyltransferase
MIKKCLNYSLKRFIACILVGIAWLMKRITAFGGAALSGLCVYLAFSHMVPWLGWVALVPLFLVLDRGYRTGRRRNDDSSLKVEFQRGGRSSGFLPGLVAGATLSVCAFAWMIPGAHAFTGAAMGYGIAIFVICVLVFSFGCAILLWKTPPVLVAPVWILAETLLQWAAAKMPFFLFHIGNALATELIAIQPMSVIGVTGAGFVVILVNFLVARAVKRRTWKHALAPLLLLGTYLAWGWWLLRAEDLRGPAFPMAIVKENIPPDVPWDSTNGNARVQQLLQQEDSCVAAGARMLLWSESAIPWTYSPDDDLLKEVLHRSRSRSIVHVLGMNTAVSAGVVRNSAYCLLPDGQVAGRYDKHDPLLFIEQPALGLQFPFFSSDGYSVEPGEDDKPLSTPYGKAGVLICNESALPGAAAARVRQGAQFLLNMSNDGWFRDTWLVAQHFYNARLRAVETRKDVVINSNNGWSGCIHASGRVDTTGFLFTIHPNTIRPVAVRYPLLPVVGVLLFALIITGTAPGGFRKFINQKTRLL